MKKTLFLLMFALAMLPATSVSQSIDLTTARQNYLVGLRSDNTGLVESSIYYVLHLVNAYPLQPTAEIRHQLIVLNTTAKENRIRYKAGIALLLLSQPDIMRQLGYSREMTADQYFSEAMERMAATYLVVTPQTEL